MSHYCTILLSHVLFAIVAVFLYHYFYVQSPHDAFDLHVKFHENYKRPETFKKPTVAIIGSGVAGSSAAYFLREIFGNDINIHVYEKEGRVGGRLMKKYVKGVKVDMGGTSIIKENRYAVEFIKRFNLHYEKEKDDVAVIWFVTIKNS